MLKQEELEPRKLSNNKILECAEVFGSHALLWRRKFAGLLPEINRRRLWLAEGFIGIHHYAAMKAGFSRKTVDRILLLDRKLVKFNRLRHLFENGLVGWSKLEQAIRVVNSESEVDWVLRVQRMSRRAIETLVRELLNQTKEGETSSCSSAQALQHRGNGPTDEYSEFACCRKTDKLPTKKKGTDDNKTNSIIPGNCGRNSIRTTGCSGSASRALSSNSSDEFPPCPYCGHVAGECVKTVRGRKKVSIQIDPLVAQRLLSLLGELDKNEKRRLKRLRAQARQAGGHENSEGDGGGDGWDAGTTAGADGGEREYAVADRFKVMDLSYAIKYALNHMSPDEKTLPRYQEVIYREKDSGRLSARTHWGTVPVTEEDLRERIPMSKPVCLEDERTKAKEAASAYLACRRSIEIDAHEELSRRRDKQATMPAIEQRTEVDTSQLNDDHGSRQGSGRSGRGVLRRYKKSRYIPTAVRRYIWFRNGGVCEFPGCSRPVSILHHTRRFAINDDPDPDYLLGLCKDHDLLVHSGAVENESDPSLQMFAKVDTSVRTGEEAARVRVDNRLCEFAFSRLGPARYRSDQHSMREDDVASGASTRILAVSVTDNS